MVVLGIEDSAYFIKRMFQCHFFLRRAKYAHFLCCLQQIAIKINRKPLEYIIKLPLHNEIKYFANRKGPFL